MRALVLLLLTLSACEPEVGPRPSLVTGPRLLAVRADPPETAPNETASYRLLAVEPTGTHPDPPASWAFCTEPKPFTDNNVVGSDCIRDLFAPIGEGATVTAATPAEACMDYGPDAAAEVRPRDPDLTGGYYQPVRVALGAHVAIGLERIVCGLADAGAELAGEFRQRYPRNLNPTIAALDAPAALRPGERAALRLTWTDESVATYPVFDPEAGALVDRTEVLRVSWFVTAGELEADRTAAGGNAFTAPALPQTVYLWAVLRDDRGGVDWREATIEVEP